MRNFNFFAEKPSSSYRKSDSAFIVLILLLWGIGMVTLYFCSSSFSQKMWQNPMRIVHRQLLSSVIGFALFAVLAVTDAEKIRRFIPVIVFGSIILCLMTWIPGIGLERNGARRWIRVPYFSTFQPSETIKFAMVFFLANFFDKQEKVPLEDKSVMPALIGLVTFTVVIFAQSDFSTGIFVFLVGLILFFSTGAKLSWFIPVAGIGLPLAALMILIEPYRVNRVIGFFSQDDNLQGINWQLNNAKTAIADGGFFGQGVGTGLTKISKVPEIVSDYIFAGWTEAMGLFGVAIYMIILGLFTWRVVKISMTCGSRFASIASFGFGVTIVAQSLLNIAVVGGALPSTGIPLPFFSLGGSSIIVTLAMCGFIVNASKIEMNDDVEIITGE